MKTQIRNASSFAPGSLFSQEKWKEIGKYETKSLWWIGLEESEDVNLSIVVVGDLGKQVKANYLYELMKFSPASVQITDSTFQYS